MNSRFAPSSYLYSHSSTSLIVSAISFSFSFVYFLANSFLCFVRNSSLDSLAGLLLCGLVLFTHLAVAQGQGTFSPDGSSQQSDKSRSQERDRWMMRGRSAARGQSAALRLRAYRQKLAVRASRRESATAGSAKVESAGAGSKTATAFGDAPDGSTAWVALGPAPLISDQNIYGAVAGRVTAVAVDPSDASGNTVYAGGAAGGVWKSTNAAGSPRRSDVERADGSAGVAGEWRGVGEAGWQRDFGRHGRA